MASKLSSAVTEMIGSDATVGRVQLGFMNRIIVDDVDINDKNGRKMLSASRMSVKLNPLALFTEKIEISSAQLFGADIRINAQSKDSPLNIQYVIDLLSGDDDGGGSEIEINSFVVRRGRLRYDIFDQPRKNNVTDAAHIDIRNISGHVVINTGAGGLSIKLKNLSFKEKSGLEVKRLSFLFASDDKSMKLDDMRIELPNTRVEIPEGRAEYRKEKGRIIDATLEYSAHIANTTVNLTDIACLVPELRRLNIPLSLDASVSGTSTSLRVRTFNLQSDDRQIDVSASGSMSNFDSPSWYAAIERLTLSNKAISMVNDSTGAGRWKDVEILSRFGDISFKGSMGGSKDIISLRGNLVSGAGRASLVLGKKGNVFSGDINTPSLDLGRIINNEDLGELTAHLALKGSLRDNQKIPDVTARGTISGIDYKNHRYSDIKINASYLAHKFDGMVSVNDADGMVSINGNASYFGKNPYANFKAKIRRFNPQALGLTDKWKESSFDMDIDADFKGRDIDQMEGTLDISDFRMDAPEDTLVVDRIQVMSGYSGQQHYMQLRSDFADADMKGCYDHTTFVKSIKALVARRMPALVPVTDYEGTNDFTMNVKLKNALWMKMLLGVPLEISSPVMLSAEVRDTDRALNVKCRIPEAVYDGSEYCDGLITIDNEGDSLRLDGDIVKVMGNGHHMDLNLQMAAAADRLMSKLTWDNNREGEFMGFFNAATNFTKDKEGRNITKVNIFPSEMTIGGVKWFVRPADIILADKSINIDNFTAENDRQHLIISGKATDNSSDSITVSLHDMEVAYILDLVNFHAVNFSGRASGKAYVSSVFGKPRATADLTVDDFRFQGGRLGRLYAAVCWNNTEEQVDIDAVADDTPTGKTYIKGYVSPKKDYLSLNIGARNMRAEFLEGFCGSFMNHVTATVQGDVFVGGPLSRVNMDGDLYVTGGLGIKSVGTDYILHKVNVHCEPDEIRIINGDMSDATGGTGILNGSLHHISFTKLKFDIGIESDGLPMYNTTAEGGDTFYGTVYIDGKCRIHGNSDDVNIDVDARPVKNSEMIYDASAPDAISSRNFIRWKTPDSKEDTTEVNEELYNSSDIRMNLNVDVTPDMTLRVLLDKESGDNIALRGDAALRATYYNKGPFNMYGTYNIGSGEYRLTIQQILEKKFNIQNGSRIVFAGDPYDATLNLKAVHTVNGVSLSDLRIGKSFSNNTIRVNCIMGIKGTPDQPRVDFDIDMPTVDGDVQQMIRSMITTEEDMNRQVVYILGIGRFYMPEDNNMETETGPSQTSLAMQSLLSGTISSQINSILSRLVKSNEWNFGANISTGDEGWNNAEYEGILSGNLLDNRLLINGQFGYRDNANATTGFIGDFDIRYLLFPSGNLAARLYNQTNDRYFTKTSLTTQGVGLIMKKDFWGLKDFFGIDNKKKNKKNNVQQNAVHREKNIE